MTDPEDDEELAQAISDRTIPVPDPTKPPEPIESRETEVPDTEGDDTELGQNVDDFEIDVPPPEGI